MIDGEKIMQWLLARFPRPVVIVLRILGGVSLVCGVAIAGVIYAFAPGILVYEATQSFIVGIAFGSVWLIIHFAVLIHYDDVETWLNKTYPPRKSK